MEEHNRLSNQSSTPELAQYFIAELQMLHERAALQEQIRANKTNYLLVLVTAIIGGLLLLSQNSLAVPYLVPMSFITSSTVLLLGLATFRQSLDLAANSIWYYRRAGRIRRWIVDQYPSARVYMPFRIGDDTPKFWVAYARWRNVDELLVAVNSVAVGTVVFFAVLYASNGVLPWAAVSPLPGAVVPAVIIAVTAWLLQMRYAKHFLLRKEQEEASKGHVMYPVADFSFQEQSNVG